MQDGVIEVWQLASMVTFDAAWLLVLVLGAFAGTRFSYVGTFAVVLPKNVVGEIRSMYDAKLSGTEY